MLKLKDLILIRLRGYDAAIHAIIDFNLFYEGLVDIHANMSPFAKKLV